jgi:hypothetical protein
LVNLDQVKIWGFFDLAEGKVQSIEYFEDRNSFDGWIDVVVVANKYDDVWQFQQESIPVLEAPVQREIDDVIEAFLFKSFMRLQFREH